MTRRDRNVYIILGVVAFTLLLFVMALPGGWLP